MGVLFYLQKHVLKANDSLTKILWDIFLEIASNITQTIDNKGILCKKRCMDFQKIHTIILGNPYIMSCEVETRLIALSRIQKQKYLVSCQIKVLLTRVK